MILKIIIRDLILIFILNKYKYLIYIYIIYKCKYWHQVVLNESIIILEKIKLY